MHLDVICIIHSTFIFYVQLKFFENGWDLKKKKKHTQAVQFLQLVVHMYFVPVKFFILEIKGKNPILEEKIVWPLNVASPRPGLEFGLLVVSSNF